MSRFDNVALRGPPYSAVSEGLRTASFAASPELAGALNTGSLNVGAAFAAFFSAASGTAGTLSEPPPSGG